MRKDKYAIRVIQITPHCMAAIGGVAGYSTHSKAHRQVNEIEAMARAAPLKRDPKGEALARDGALNPRGDIIQESRAALSRYTRAASSESAASRRRVNKMSQR